MTTIVNTAYGYLRGTTEDGIKIFKGIPYAKPPIAELRWKPPQPSSLWDGVLDATKFGYSSWSYLVGDDNSNASEDCLYLNIWTQNTESGAKLPVMVYVHEGGFVFGNPSKPFLDGQRLAQKGVVVVTFNYRLGPLGFLALPELDQEGSISGMFGIQDQHAALRWLKKNVESFGGDPNNITLFGESAGAHSIGLMMVSPASKGLFHKAILQSGAFWNQIWEHDMDFDRARQHGKQIFEKLGVSSLAELRDVPAEKFVEAFPFDFSGTPDRLNFAPHIDKNVLPDKALRMFQRNEQMKIPVLAGFTSDEGTVFRNILKRGSTKQEWETIGKSIAGPERLPEFLSLYPVDSFGAPLPKSVTDFVGDLYLAHQTWKAATSQIATGVENVYMYLFSYTSEYNPMPMHASDIQFTFGTIDQPQWYNPPFVDYSEADRKFSDAMITYWTNFAKNGDPNGKGRDDLPVWPKYKGDEGNVMGLGRDVGQTEIQAQRLRYIDSLFKDGSLCREWLDLASSPDITAE